MLRDAPGPGPAASRRPRPQRRRGPDVVRDRRVPLGGAVGHRIRPARRALGTRLTVAGTAVCGPGVDGQGPPCSPVALRAPGSATIAPEHPRRRRTLPSRLLGEGVCWLGYPRGCPLVIHSDLQSQERPAERRGLRLRHDTGYLRSSVSTGGTTTGGAAAWPTAVRPADPPDSPRPAPALTEPLGPGLAWMWCGTAATRHGAEGGSLRHGACRRGKRMWMRSDRTPARRAGQGGAA